MGIGGFALPAGANGPSCRLVAAARRPLDARDGAVGVVDVDRGVPDIAALSEVLGHDL